MKFNFENTYKRLPEIFYSEVEPSKVKNPSLVMWNNDLAKELEIDREGLSDLEISEIFSGNRLLEGMEPIAQAYGGHQFGQFNMLGDGRAILLGEQVKENGERFDITLKGSGRTPYSRGGDGKAHIKAMLREYIISEGMKGLNISTTRSLAVCLTGENIIREDLLKGAVLTRVSKSHIRVGTFQYASVWGSNEELKALADYTLNRHFKGAEEGDNPYLNLLKGVIKNQARLVAKWMNVGFIHGVLNTDNILISGETIDYGPCAFMDTYNSKTVFSSIDYYGRYAYSNQPNMVGWNLARFAESLLPLLDSDREAAINMAQKAIEEYGEIYEKFWMEGILKKLGIFKEEEADKYLVEGLLSIMEKQGMDFTNTFYHLTNGTIEDDAAFKARDFRNWCELWGKRIATQKEGIEASRNLMMKNNPVVIPRNFRVEEALEAAEQGDYSKIEKLLEVLKNPYDYENDLEEYTRVFVNEEYRTYCGT